MYLSPLIRKLVPTMADEATIQSDCSNDLQMENALKAGTTNKKSKLADKKTAITTQIGFDKSVEVDNKHFSASVTQAALEIAT